jgi:hypothetical protein
MMLVAASGYKDAFWRPSAWYLNILVDLQPKPGQAKIEKMEKIVVRMEKFIIKMEKFPVKMEKILYVPGRIGAATLRQYLVASRQDTRNVHYVACSAPKCDLGAENAAEKGE